MFRGLATSKSGAFGEMQADQPDKSHVGQWRRVVQAAGRRVTVSREKPGEVGRSQFFQSPRNRAAVQGGYVGVAVNTGASADCPRSIPNQ